MNILFIQQYISRKPITNIILILFLTGLNLSVGHARVPLEAPSDVEMKLLPEYCKDTEWFPDRYGKRKGYWTGRMGETFWHMHHYCWAILSVNRSRKALLSKEQRTSLLESAFHDYNYVINKAPDTFILLPEILTKLGELHLLRKDPNKANEAFIKARQLNPSYWPAYTHWIEYLIHIRDFANASTLLEEGLRNSPDSKVLKDQYFLLKK